MGIFNFFKRNSNNKEKSTKKYKGYHKNGKLELEGQLLNNKQEGFWKYYHDNESLEAEGVFKNGKKNGLWKAYYEEGGLYNETNYVEGVEEGLSKFYDEVTGQRRQYLTYINGEKNGVFKYFNKNGHVLCEGIYESEEEKDWKYYDENGHIKKPIQNQNGFNRIFNDSGGYQEIHKNKGLFNGEMKIYNKYGGLIQHVENLIQEEKNGGVFPDGKETIRYDSGSLKIVSNLKKGLKEGYVICYSEQGFIDKISFYENNEDVSLGSFENQKMLLREIYNYMKLGEYFYPGCYMSLCKSLGYKGSDADILGNPKEIIKNLLSLLK